MFVFRFESVVIRKKSVNTIILTCLFQAHRKHPEFSTLYMNTLQRVNAEFSALKIFLHQDALLSITTLVEAFQTAVEKSKPKDAASEVKKLRRRDSSVSLASLSSAISKLEPKKKRGK